MTKCKDCGYDLSTSIFGDHPCAALSAVHSWLQRHGICACDTPPKTETVLPDWLTRTPHPEYGLPADYLESQAIKRFNGEI